MVIDGNTRARLGAKLRLDKRLSHATFRVANAALFGCMDARNGRCQAYRARVADQAKCCVKTVSRATATLEELGYIQVVPTWGKRHRADGKRWFRPRGPNVIEWRIPAGFSVGDKVSPYPRDIINKPPSEVLPEGLARVLTRFGNAIADRSGLPEGSMSVN